MIIGYAVLRWHVMDITVFHFELFFSPFTPLTTRNMKISTKMRKPLQISFYTSVPKIMIICYTVPEKWHVIHVIFIFHFGFFFALLSPNSPKDQNLKKMTKMPQDIIMLHMRTKNHNHMRHSSGDAIILNLCNKKQSNNVCVCLLRDVGDIIFCHFRSFFAFSPHY